MTDETCQTGGAPDTTHRNELASVGVLQETATIETAVRDMNSYY
jgi:hypothetical protein